MCLECCAQFWTAQNKKDVDVLAHHSATNVVRELNYMTFQRRPTQRKEGSGKTLLLFTTT